MNRSERRRLGLGAVKTYTLADADLDRIKREACDDAVRDAFVLMVALPCLALRDEFGFGRERLVRFATRAVGWLEAVNRGDVEIRDAVDQLREETGIEINDHGDGRLGVWLPDLACAKEV